MNSREFPYSKAKKLLPYEIYEVFNCGGGSHHPGIEIHPGTASGP